MKIVRHRMVAEEVEIPETLDEFLIWEFTSGSTTGEDFKAFAKLFLKDVKSALPPGAKMVNVSTGHYILSGFVEKDGKYVYFSISDVRHFPRGWYSNILIRTAQHEKDYTGGSNGSTTLEDLGRNLDRMLDSERLHLSL